ncbi:FecCD family ABC transporter permease [Sulfurisphaera javensis]|uniref:FecCD family ABC transporter permease n=1 Tax=Sulfurisphaera javensis TaxID=2049879 RepID=UPI0034E88529
MDKLSYHVLKYIFVILLPISFFLGLIFGEVRLSISQILHPSGVYSIILFDIRLPTVISAMLIGVLISLSGAILQHLLKNPLVDPYISGTASGGAFGAVLTYFLLAFNLPFSWLIYFQPIVAFFTATLATLITVGIGRKGNVYAIVVGGVVVSYIFSSLTTILLVIFQQKYPQIPPLTFWLLGEISIIGWEDVIILFILTVVMLFLTIKFSRVIDLVAISDEISYTHNINPGKFRLFWLLLVSLVTAYIVSIAGIIGFVGIIVPHIARRIDGSMRGLSVYSPLIGSVIMEFSNIVSRGIFGTIIPITAITALIASPLIISILVRVNAGQGVES